MIIHGDSLERLKTLDANSVDAVVCDGPYELGFMSKGWDKTGIVNDPKFWREVLRVMKPGAHLLNFGGTRTYHRMACAVEDAGFEIRDCIFWHYGSGFPKSLNVTKQIEKQYACQFTESAKLAGKRLRLFPVELPEGKIAFAVVSAAIQPVAEQAPKMVIGVAVDSSDQTATSLYASTEHIDLSTILSLNERLDAASSGANNAITLTELKTITGLKIWPLLAHQSTLKSTVAQNHTALKPATEPIVLARKPLEKGLNVAQNCLKWGTGALNVDESRIGTEQTVTRHTRKAEGSGIGWHPVSTGEKTINQGRWPANLILDEESARLLDEQSGVLKSGALKPYKRSDDNYYSGAWPDSDYNAKANSGGASRFFYVAKASKRERNAGLEGLEHALKSDAPEWVRAEVLKHV